jgi:hypothetical protein
MGTNIGQVSLKVILLSGSPFSGQPKQESVTYFTQDVFRALTQERCAALPAPINGIRLQEIPGAYDNFLEDTEETPLEKAFYTQKVSVFNGDTQETEERQVSVTVAPSAAARLDELQKKPTTDEDEEGDGGSTTAAKGSQQEELDALQKSFFTWATSNNLFKIGDKNPAPPKFTEASLGNAPAWTYIAMDRPGGKNKSKVLAPFMRKCPPDSLSPVHWGVVMKQAMAKNQPFEVIFYSCTRDPSIAKDAAPLDPLLSFVDQDGAAIDLGLTGSVYFAVEIGRGSGLYNYLVIFKNEDEPYFFQLTGKNAVLLARFSGFNAAKLFDRNQRYFTISVEPVVSSLIIRSNAFAETPWIIQAPFSRPVFVGEGMLALYGGNIQGAFAMRPIRYHETGTFTSPEISFSLAEGKGSGEKKPTCSFALKGDGEIEQDRAAPAGKNAKSSQSGQSDQVVNMVDAEDINGEKGITIVEKDVADAKTEGVDRKVSMTTEEVPDKSGKPAASSAKINIVNRKFKTTVTMTAGSVTQPDGYVVENGRSPYVWMTRCEVPEDEGDEPGETQDISCDVMSIDLNWNATSYNEISHTGTMKVLNNKQNGVDYRQFTNRAVYLRIEAGWVGGKGKPPGRIFEGLATGYTVDTVAEREVVTFKLEDYMSALQGAKFQLCPFYDGMKASLAVRDIVKTLGLSDGRIMADETPIKDANLKDDFGLPFVNPFEEPQFRFKNGTSFKEGILKIAKLDFKTIYFDQEGRFHYDTLPGGIYNNRSFKLKANFFSSPHKGGKDPADLVWNMTSFSRLINDVYNAISIKTVSRRSLAWLAQGVTYKAGIYDPNAEGYLGYSKKLFIEDPAIGSADALGKYVNTLRNRVFIPPMTGRFETYGRPGMKPLDVITLDGQMLRVMSVSTRLSASDNQFWMNIDGEWQFSANKDQDPALNNANAGGGAGAGGAGSASAKG